MRTLPAAVLALTTSAVLVGGAVAAGASVATGGKPPVKIDGKVNNHGTAKVKKGDAIAIEADDFYYDATYLKGKAGKTIGVTITNEGDVDHTFTIDDQGVDEELAPGDSIDVDVKVPADGKPAVFFCRFHESAGMKGAVFSKKGAKASSGSTGGTSGGSGGTTATTSGGGGGYGY